MMRVVSRIVTVLAAALPLAACGSGSAVTLPQAQKTAKVVFSAATTASLPTAVRVIRLTALIPAGVAVPLVGSTKEVQTSALTALKPGSAVLGSYSAPLLKLVVTGDMASPTGLGADNVRAFAEVLLTYPAATVLTESSFTAINSPFPDFAATGLNGGSSTTLTGSLKPSVKVTF